MSSTRQLAAIMFTDIVGYTSLMGSDEQKAMDLVRKNKEIQKPLVERNNGNWLKEMGDGALSSFPTASDAVNCALQIQEALNDDDDLNLRIGIHLGEIILEVGDVYGDGVNIASRLQSITEPGGIYISDAVQKSIRGNKNIQYALLGELELKNVDYPVKTYALRAEFLPRPKKTEEKNLSGRLMAELQRRNVHRAGLAYLAVAFIIYSLTNYIDLGSTIQNIIFGILILGIPLSIFLAWNYERSPEGFVRVTSRKAWVNPYSDTQKKPFTGNTVIIILLLIIVGIVAFPKFPTTDPDEVNSARAISGSIKKSIAVLPFENLSNDPEQQYFSDGIQEDILNHLSKIADLSVKSRSSTLRYRENRPGINEIGADLGVGTILEGSVRKSGNMVRISAQLIDVETDDHIWSEIYDRELTEVFIIQSEVAMEIARVLEVKLSDTQEDLISKSNTHNVTAYDYVLKARELRKKATSESDYDRALALLQEAIQVDNSYAEAYAEMAGILYFDKTSNRVELGVAQQIWLDSALALVNKSIELDPGLSYAYLVRSTIYRRPLYKYDLARQDLQKAYEIDPNNPEILEELSVVLRNEGEYEKSAQMKIKSIDLGPGPKDYEFYYNWARIYWYIGEFEKAIDLYDQGLKLSPGNPIVLGQLGWMYFSIGKVEESTRSFEEAWKNSGSPAFLLWAGECNLFTGNLNLAKQYFERVELAENQLDDPTALFPFRPKLAAIYMKEGKKDEANELLDETMKLRKNNLEKNRYDFWTRSNASAFIELAEIFAMRNMPDEAMEYLENPISWEWWDPAGALRFLENSPQFDSIRNNSRFKSHINALKKEYRLSSEPLRRIIREREAKEQMKLGLEK